MTDPLSSSTINPEENPLRSDAGPSSASRLRRLGVLGVAILFLFVVVSFFGGRWWLARWSAHPHGAPASHQFVIPPGASARAIAADLDERNLVTSDRTFLLWLRLTGNHSRLQAGEYTIETPIAPVDLVAALGRGSFERALTIPEGWTSRQIAARLKAQNWIADEQAWLDLVAPPAQLLDAQLPLGLEGFCFPDTYRLDRGATPDAILRRMTDQFVRQWRAARPDDRATASRSLSLFQVVTLASMVEREARTPDEMPRIAAVYLNRLARNMKLQCCATVYRALGDGAAWERPLTYADLKTDSPYNTYRYAGLPPGPIANPGRLAIEAVLRPAESDDLFYVYAGDGRHIFSRTYGEHQAAVRSVSARNPQANVLQQQAD
jgi:UPF0755 protein